MSATRSSVHDVVVVILGGGRGSRLEPLTRLRSKPAVPLAGKYRLIDVPLSNAIHSGMERIFVLTQYNSVSLHRHINSAYKFAPFSRGFVEVLAAQQTPSGEHWFQGTADAVRQNLEFISERRGDLALILSGDHLYRCDYRHMMETHVEHDAAITISVLPCSEEEIGEFGAVRVDDTGRIVEFREKPGTSEAREGMKVPEDLIAERGMSPERPYLASMGIYLFDQNLLAESLAGEHNDFGKEVIPAAVDRCRVQAHFFEGYWRDIGTIGAFYDAHMDLVTRNPPFDFHDPDWPIYTNPRFLPGSRITTTAVDRSVIAEGARIEGSTVEQSIVGVRSTIFKSVLRRTLLLGADSEAPDAAPGDPGIGIGEGTVIENAIVDKNARIGVGVRLVNEQGVQEADGPGWTIRDGIIVIKKNAIIPDGAVV